MKKNTGKVLVLKSVKENMASDYDPNFIYPQKGLVEAKDWNPSKECGGGLHGWLWGVGDFSSKVRSFKAKWLVIEVDENEIIDLVDKVKFRKGKVVFCGSFVNAYLFLLERKPLNKKTITGDSGHAAATGDYGHAAATGNSGHAAATGDYGHAATTGYYGHAAATGNSGHAAATGYSGHAAATGDSGHAAATGDYGHAAATGNSGHAAILGLNGMAKCGKGGSIILTYNDGERERHLVGYEGEGILADTWYCVKVVKGKAKFVKSNQ